MRGIIPRFGFYRKVFFLPMVCTLGLAGCGNKVVFE